MQAAAVAAGVGERTVYRRLDDPGFKRRLEEARGEILGRAVARLTGASVSVRFLETMPEPRAVVAYVEITTLPADRGAADPRGGP